MGVTRRLFPDGCRIEFKQLRHKGFSARRVRGRTGNTLFVVLPAGKAADHRMAQQRLFRKLSRDTGQSGAQSRYLANPHRPDQIRLCHQPRTGLDRRSRPVRPLELERRQDRNHGVHRYRCQSRARRFHQRHPMGQSRRRDRARRRDQRAFQGPPRLHRGRRARAPDRRWPAQLSTGANPRNLLCVRTQQSAHPYRRLSTHHQSRLQRRPRAGLDLLRPAARRVLNKAAPMALQDIRPAVLGQALRPNIWDVVALVLVVGAMVLIVYGGEQTVAPLSTLNIAPVSLDPANLPLYALRTPMRMLLAIVCSIIFTFIYAALAAKSRRAEIVLIPLLDILQSVPILGFLTFTVVFFMNLFPGRALGAELACGFAIFTSQAWNMTFSMYQSMRNVPKDLEEASQSFHLSGWQRFWRLDVPFAMPGLIWNTMMSMSGGWFFVVASEAITVGDTTVTLPGIGSYVALAIKEQNLPAIGYAILAMFLVILAYDQLLFRPVVAWADKFRFEQTASATAPASWMLDLFRHTRALRALSYLFAALNKAISNLHVAVPGPLRMATRRNRQPSRIVDAVWLALVI